MEQRLFQKSKISKEEEGVRFPYGSFEGGIMGKEEKYKVWVMNDSWKVTDGRFNKDDCTKDRTCAVCGTNKSYPSWYRKDGVYYCEECGDNLTCGQRTSDCDAGMQIE